MNCKWTCRTVLAALIGFSVPGRGASLQEIGENLCVTGRDYRITFGQNQARISYELKDGQGEWQPVSTRSFPHFAVTRKGSVWETSNVPCAFAVTSDADRVLVGMNLPIQPLYAVTADIHFICTDDGVLIRFALHSPETLSGSKAWPMPRIQLDSARFDAYTFWREPDEMRSGTFASLGETETYAGVSAWGQNGDVCPQLSPRHPALIARSPATGSGLGVVFVDYDRTWKPGHMFIQRYRADILYLYSGMLDVAELGRPVWAWLAPFTGNDTSAFADRVEELLGNAEVLTRNFAPIAPKLSDEVFRPIPDFPAELRRAAPVSDINDSVVYTINEYIHGEDGITMARKVGSDVLIRAWFKWHNAPDWSAMADLVPQVHAMGALFGGGLTCSALYDGENGLSEAEVLDMATRGPAGQLVDAWDTPGCRHGTLSNPKYLEYLLSWARKQIDAGADYLFMDEVNAALRSDEGFDDYSLRDFRDYLRTTFCDGQGWEPDDARWRERFDIDLTRAALAPDGTIGSFDYRAYLAAHDLVADPRSSQNPLAGEFRRARRERDDRAWKWLTDAMHAYAAGKGKQVFISGNGLEKYVDLQVLGVWGDWRIVDDHVDFSESQMPAWTAKVGGGCRRAGKHVPVVFFHDWGFGGFPWMKVSPAERTLWIRIRGAEIYASGGFFAFPMLGPAGCNALRDGTIREIARQAAFYQRHRDLYLKGRLQSIDLADSAAEDLSTSLWRRDDPPALVVHVINRRVDGTALPSRRDIQVVLPLHALPTGSHVVSPDWQGEQKAGIEDTPDGLRLTFPELDAYAVAVLDYAKLPVLKAGSLRIVPMAVWERPEENEFPIDRIGMTTSSFSLNGFLQGQLHPHLRNPPTFLVNALGPVKLSVQVRAVATLGARLECSIDGAPLGSVDLPDRDGRNDGAAGEYLRTCQFDIPAGRHRVSLANTGGDWLTVDWYAFNGELADW